MCGIVLAVRVWLGGGGGGGGGGKDVHMPFEYQLAVDAAKSKGSGHQGPMGGHKHILFLDL